MTKWGFQEGRTSAVHSDLLFSEPQFVGSFDVGEHVYFFFREVAIESGGAERSVYSRVARVCKVSYLIRVLKGVYLILHASEGHRRPCSSAASVDVVCESASELLHLRAVSILL